MRSDQVANSAGGFVWEVDCWTRLNRFLILGSEGGSYYISEQKLTKENVAAVRECLAIDGPRTVGTIVTVSQDGRAPKNDPALYALACAISDSDPNTRRLAAQALPLVARIGTHLYHFVAYAETMRGWGRTMRWAISNWYAQKPDQLALQAIKYRQRDGWSHRDLLRLAHPKNDDNAAIFDWIAHGRGEGWEHGALGLEFIAGFERAQVATTPKETADLVRTFNLPREALLTEHLNSPEVWAAMLDMGMPMTAMLRNLANMTRNGILDSRDYLLKVCEAFSDQGLIRRSRLHPLSILIGLRTYALGHGLRGSNEWTPKPDVIDALDAAFYTAFDNVEPMGKSYLLGLDVSGSMGYGMIAGLPITPREAAAAMALVTLHVEADVTVMGFQHDFVPLGFSRRQRLDDACAMVDRLPFGATDCSLPMQYAQQQGMGIDTFCVYTDSETWFGDIHPKQALDSYRQTSGRASREVVVGMLSNSFSIADPNDAGMLDVCGFDTATPALIADFSAGRI